MAVQTEPGLTDSASFVKDPTNTRVQSSYSILLLHSALQPLWVLACSNVVEYSQQEGFYRVPLPAARQTPKLEDQWLERSNSGVSSVWNDSFIMISWYIWTSVAEGGNYGREIAENFTESGDFHVTFGFFYMP